MALFIPFKQIMEAESASMYESFKREFDKLVVGTISLPINIPGTSYYHGFQVYISLESIVSHHFYWFLYGKSKLMGWLVLSGKEECY